MVAIVRYGVDDPSNALHLGLVCARNYRRSTAELVAHFPERRHACHRDIQDVLGHPENPEAQVEALIMAERVRAEFEPVMRGKRGRRIQALRAKYAALKQEVRADTGGRVAAIATRPYPVDE